MFPPPQAFIPHFTTLPPAAAAAAAAASAPGGGGGGGGHWLGPILVSPFFDVGRAAGGPAVAPRL